MLSLCRGKVFSRPRAEVPSNSLTRTENAVLAASPISPQVFIRSERGDGATNSHLADTEAAIIVIFGARCHAAASNSCVPAAVCRLSTIPTVMVRRSRSLFQGEAKATEGGRAEIAEIIRKDGHSAIKGLLSRGATATGNCREMLAVVVANLERTSSPSAGGQAGRPAV